ncbi:purine nucleoside phosphorylase [Drosophila montana]|uniref:purine nucleoside phosphorylase n=1 Tax=Drosophila montana TaxID=40370 RepID=UPI00313D53A0
MCNKDCCALKTALQIRRMKILIEQRRQEEANAKPKDIIVTPDSLIYSYDDIEQMAKYIISRTEIRPKFGIVCGSNLDTLAELIDNPIVIDYTDIPKFPEYTAQGLNSNKLFVGRLNGATVIALQGRLHHYEGNPLGSCSMPVRVLKLCGIEYLFLTCTAGAVNKNYRVGDIVLVKDHINLLGWFGNNPLKGPNDLRFGDRHVNMANAYDVDLIEKALEIGLEIGQEDRIHPGVYACLGGPVYETLTEHKFLRNIGVDAVGMSLVQEVIYARHCGLKVFSFSLISMPAIEHPDVPENVRDMAIHQGTIVGAELLSRMLYKIHNNL